MLFIVLRKKCSDHQLKERSLVANINDRDLLNDEVLWTHFIQQSDLLGFKMFIFFKYFICLFICDGRCVFWKTIQNQNLCVHLCICTFLSVNGNRFV